MPEHRHKTCLITIIIKHISYLMSKVVNPYVSQYGLGIVISKQIWPQCIYSFDDENKLFEKKLSDIENNLDYLEDTD
jgi:hypothetical protein